MLALESLSLEFDGVTALDGVSFGVERGTVCGLIGPNGAGKTSLLNCVSRLYRPTAGSVSFEGTDVLTLRAHRLRELGIARTFQHVGAFPSLTVRENVELGAAPRPGARFWSSLGPRRAPQIDERVDEALERLRLAPLADARASELPYGTLKRVELARALAGQPRLLLLDEPAAGLVQSEVQELSELIRALRGELGLTVILIEHHMGLVMGTCDDVVVLNFGRVLTRGTPAAVQQDPHVAEAYLGTAA